MDDLEAMLIERACMRLVTRFCELVDAYDHEVLTSLWADDAVWHTWKGPLRGKEQIRAYLDAKPQGSIGVHVVQNIIVTVELPDSAAATSVFTYYGGDTSAAESRIPRAIGRFRDRFKLTSDGWKFASRATEIIYTA